MDSLARGSGTLIADIWGILRTVSQARMQSRLRGPFLIGKLNAPGYPLISKNPLKLVGCGISFVGVFV